MQITRLPPILLPGLASFVVIGSAQSLYGPAIPVYMRDLGLGQSAAGLLISAHAVGAFGGVALMILRAALLTARITLLMIAAGAGVIAAGVTWPIILSGAMLLGAGFGALAAIFNRRFLNEFGTRGPAMVGILNAVFGIGAIGAPLVFVWLGHSTQAAFGVVALMALLLAPFAGAEKMAPQLPGGALRAGLRPGILVIGALAIGCEALAIGLGPSALVNGGMSPTGAAQLTSLFFAVFMVARLSLVWVAPLFRPYTLMVLSVVGCAVSALGAALISPGLFYVLSGGFAAMIFPPFFVCAVARLGDDPRIAPMIIGAGLTGGILAPLLAGAVLLVVGSTALFWLLAGYGVIVALIALRAVPRVLAA